MELAITLLYQLGEGAAEETLKPGSGTLGQLATGATPQHLLHSQPVAVVAIQPSASQPFASHPFCMSPFLHLNLLHLNLLHSHPFASGVTAFGSWVCELSAPAFFASQSCV